MKANLKISHMYVTNRVPLPLLCAHIYPKKRNKNGSFLFTVCVHIFCANVFEFVSSVGTFRIPDLILSAGMVTVTVNGTWSINTCNKTST